MNYGKALEYMSKPPAARMKDIQNVCRHLCNTIKSSENFQGKVSFSDRPVLVDMIQLNNPDFVVQNKRGNDLQRFKPQELPGAWGRNAGGPIRDSKLAQEAPVSLKQWKVVYFEGYKRHAEQLCQQIEAYKGMRKINRSGLLETPAMFELHIQGDLCEERNYKTTVSNGDQLLLIILPPKIASQVKTYFTKAVHYTNHSNPPQLQFILAENCFNKNAALAAVANSLAKIGNMMYNLAEPYKNAFGPLGNAWVVGLDVAHNGQRKPSIACMALISEPLSGSAKSWRPSCAPNKPRQEVVSGRMADGLMRSLLEDIYLQDLLPRADAANKTVLNLLPPCILIIRDGLADDQIYESINEEILGIDTAIKKFAASKKLNWNPKIVALVSPKSGQDDVCRVRETA